MLCTNSGYKSSVIFSLLAKSKALSKGILRKVRYELRIINATLWPSLPNTLQVHRADLHNMSDLLALENTISAPTCHAGHIEQLGTIDHVII